jgi:hypothetical protein
LKFVGNLGFGNAKLCVEKHSTGRWVQRWTSRTRGRLLFRVKKNGAFLVSNLKHLTTKQQDGAGRKSVFGHPSHMGWLEKKEKN